MNKKAFTLIELLAVIAILSLLVTIATPKVLETINRNRNNGYHEIETRLEQAAAKYIVNEYIDSTVNTISITKEDLINAKYIGEIYDLKDNSICNASVEVTNLRSVPIFNAVLECSSYTTDISYVEFNVVPNGGTISQEFKSKYITDTIIELSTPVKNGAEFAGWEVVQGNSVINGNILTIGTTTTTIYAKWDNWPTLTVEYNGGKNPEGGGQIFEKTYKSGTNLTLEPLIKDGYVFTGWKIKSGNSILSGNSFTMGSENTTIEATFAQLIVQAIYSETDNSLIFINDRQYSIGETYNGKSVTAVYTGFTTTEYDDKTTIPWYSYRENVKKVEFIDEVKPISLANWFRGFSSCTEMNLKKLNTSNVASLYHTFEGMSSLTTLDIKHFDTSNVTTLNSMFSECSKLKVLDLSHFNTRKVKSMECMFFNCKELTTLDLSNFDTPNLTTMLRMFQNCSNLITLDLSNFNTSNVTDMSRMFSDCDKLTSLDISNFDTSKVTDMSKMFRGMTKLKTLYVSDKWTTSAVTSSTEMFIGSTSLVGGLGTTYNSSYIDKTYARIDNKPSTPGYFSTKATYTITYNLNGGTVNGINVTSLDYGKSTTLIAPTKSGYKFTGWTVSSGVLSGNSFTIGNSNVTITANFTPLVIQAIYSETDNSLMFINDRKYSVGETYNGKTVTAVYTGFTTTEYEETTIPWYSYRENVKKVEFIDEIKPTSLAHWFEGFSACTEMNLKKLNTSNVTNMYYAFSGMTNIESLDLSNFNTSNVINMGRMFNCTNKLKNLNISSFDTSNVTHMRGMFSGASSLTTLDLSHFNTSKVARMDFMFNGMSGLTNLDLSSFNTSNVTDMTDMFSNCTSLISLNLSSFNTLKVTNMGSMFNGCSKLTTLDLSSFNTSNVTDMAWMFVNCSELTNLDISNFNTSNVTTMYGMFSTCKKLTTLDLSSFNTLKVTSMKVMFDGCQSLTTLDLSNFNTSNVTNMSGMFQNCLELTNLDLSNFDTSSVTTMSQMFYMLGRDTTSFTLKLGNKFNVSKVTDMNNLFYYTCYNSTTCSIDLGSAFNTSNVTNMSYMFYQTGYSSTTCSINLGSAFNTSKVTNMESMFNRACSHSTSTTLNLGSNFDTSNVTNMNGMFEKFARNDTKITLDLTSFNTAKVIDMSNMFSGITKISKIYVSDKWTTSSVTTSTGMFTGCTSLVGGSGTTFNSSYIDKTYARIDGGSSNPGYFNEKS